MRQFARAAREHYFRVITVFYPQITGQPLPGPVNWELKTMTSTSWWQPGPSLPDQASPICEYFSQHSFPRLGSVITNEVPCLDRVPGPLLSVVHISSGITTSCSS